ncbi:hypothetical protein ANCCEY_07359 [Ancylostoma ceylanicum]|uniref:Uncharacterized protein n=1 Tax=Ancylostoma ceylanicum TaxID=53326 RepID=A0A0D6LQQ9_9BILA|nr:hypothetical protein ANCCEY_07359 [Ancylostoma ceylanicum]
MPPPAFLPSFGKATSKGLGVAANIMSKFGYKHGAGLAAPPTTTAPPMGVGPVNMAEAMKCSTKVLMLTVCD